jgi:hypothetical protein
VGVAMAVVAAISLAFTPAAPASTTVKTSCGPDTVRFADGNFTDICFKGKGTIAYNIDRVTRFETGPNVVRIAWMDRTGAYYSQVFEPYYGRASKLQYDGSFTPLYERVYQIWIL